MTATPFWDWLVLVWARVGVLVFGKSDRLADPGVEGELRLIWLKELAVLAESVGRLSFGRSAGGRGAGPGFINWSEVYMVSFNRGLAPGSMKVSDSSRTMRGKRWLDSIVCPASVVHQEKKRKEKYVLSVIF